MRFYKYHTKRIAEIKSIINKIDAIPSDIKSDLLSILNEVEWEVESNAIFPEVRGRKYGFRLTKEQVLALLFSNIKLNKRDKKIFDPVLEDISRQLPSQDKDLEIQREFLGTEG